MAGETHVDGSVAQTIVTDDSTSDYGSDFSPEEESILGDLLDRAYPDPDNPNEDLAVQLSRWQEDNHAHEIKIPLYPFIKGDHPSASPEPGKLAIEGSTLQSKAEAGASSGADRKGSADKDEPSESIDAPDTRSPLERFRSKPRKSLSVTDLISPSWCEIQYWYTLTKGKKKPTVAMQRGTAIHKTLEEQVYRTVTVERNDWIKEDSWGLRFWNIIQGLRTLRETGMTREFEVWGVVEGLLVNGVIDELSTHCRDQGLQTLSDSSSAQLMSLEGQTNITEYLGGKTLESGGRLASRRQKQSSNTRFYVTDVKTRTVKSLPRGAAFRPTSLQLMLYYRLLSDMAMGKLDPSLIFERFDLDGDARFSDSFVSQVGSLNEDFDGASQNLSQGSSLAGGSSQDSLSLLLAHNSLRALWSLVIRECAETFTRGIESISNVLTAEYRDSDHGEVIGQRTLLYDEKLLDQYVATEMKWWRGERAPEGVCIEEASKCGTCNFADICSWRANKIEAATMKMRERNKSLV